MKKYTLLRERPGANGGLTLLVWREMPGSSWSSLWEGETADSAPETGEHLARWYGHVMSA